MTRALAIALVAVLYPAAASAGVPAEQRFSRALSCGPAGSARVKGSLDASLDPSLHFARTGGRVRSARAVATLRGGADLAVEATAGASCRLDATAVARWTAPPLRFAAGPVPVIVVPRITVYVSAEARAASPVATRVHGTFSATAGLRYGGRVRRIGRFTQRLSADPPRAHAAASLSARVTPSLELLLYGAAGPRFDFGTGLDFHAGPPRGLSIPVELRAGLRLPGLEVGPLTVMSRTIPLRVPSTVSSTEPPNERARIEWDTAADVDLHVWDDDGRHTSFRESGIPGVLLSKDDTDGFGPETFEEDAPSGRRFTYGLCYFGSGEAGPTRVSVEVDGGTGRSVVTLGRRGDSALVEGAAFEPPPGWCDP